MRIVIPGGSGQVGQVLARHFHSEGHEVIVLTRSPQSSASHPVGQSGGQPTPWQVLPWDGVHAGDWTASLNQSDVVINLAGRSVNCRYNAANRAAIMNSRVDSTRILGQVIAALPHPPTLWMNASTATFYRHALDRPGARGNDEYSGELGGNEPGAPDTWNFSIDVARAWEAAFYETPTPRTRKVALRSAMTFSPDKGGVFDVLLSLVRIGLGGTIGPGTQYVSWIHDADFIRAVEFLIAHDEISGPVNLCSPNPLHNRDFQRALREAWGTRIGLPSARWMIEIGTFLMRTESELVLKSRRAVPTRLLEAGFTFQFPEWPEAARELVARWRKKHRIRP
jgi:uncharacterized protein (TIGR01777 family)